MNGHNYRLYPYRPEVGCLLVLLTLVFMCLMPFVLLDAAQDALSKLHLSPPLAMLVIVGVLLGGFVNLPAYTIEREVEQIVPRGIHGWRGWVPVVQRRLTQTIIAVNVGGCVIPAALALFEVLLILSGPSSATRALIVAVVVNIAVCYWVAQPIQGVGIAMPAFASPAVALGIVWLLPLPPDYRAPVAFVAGVLGPLVGADLFHLRDFTKVSAGVISIGGAGTFDGIVLSGMLAAFLA
jgi:uncharacterized membrane protein